MKVRLNHHYGWKSYNIQDVNSLEGAAYKALRKSHKFLTDDNHEFEIKINVPIEWAGKTSYYNTIHIFKPGKVPPPVSPLCPPALKLSGNIWFTQEFAK